MLVTANLYVGLDDCVVELVAEIRDWRTVFCLARKWKKRVRCVCVKVERVWVKGKVESWEEKDDKL